MQPASNFFALLDFHIAPALILQGTACVVLHANAKFLQLAACTDAFTQQQQTTIVNFIHEPQRLQARAFRALQSGAATYDNFQLLQGCEEVYYVTLSPLGEDIVCCTFQNICDPEPTLLWNTIEKHPELRSTLFTQLPLGISQLCEDGDDFSWVYINRPTRKLLSSTLSTLLERRTKAWWLEHMLSLDAPERCAPLETISCGTIFITYPPISFVRFSSSEHLFPEHFAAVSLKRIDNAPNGAARFVWLMDELQSPVPTIDDSEKLLDLVKARTWQLEEAMHAKERFLATMSHEIRCVERGVGVAEVLTALLAHHSWALWGR